MPFKKSELKHNIEYWNSYWELDASKEAIQDLTNMLFAKQKLTKK